MLVGRNHSAPRRVLNVLLAVAAFLLPVAAWAGGAAAGWWAPPRSNSAFGVFTGIVGGALVFFEMAIWPRKLGRRWRLGPARSWMWFHVWLGLACMTIIILHSGFALGGPLAAATLILFLLTIASGVWGLILQQWLPHKLLTDIPDETVASQVDRAVEKHVLEADNIVAELTKPPPDEDELIAVAAIGGPAKVALQSIVTGPPADQLVLFHREMLVPYLRGGRRGGSPLRSRTQADRLFARLRSGLPADALPGLAKLESLADLRRQWDTQVRVNFWLHNWLLLHLPVSVAMTVFMCVHAVMALKFW